MKQVHYIVLSLILSPFSLLNEKNMYKYRVKKLYLQLKCLGDRLVSL